MGANPGNCSGYSFAKAVVGFTLNDNPSNYRTDNVTYVERIKFADSSLALNLDGNAGTPIKS